MAFNIDLRSIPKPDEKATPEIVLTQPLMAKIGVSLALGAAGLYYLTTGRRRQEVSRMILGALLILASLFVF